MLSFQLERWGDCVAEIKPLLYGQWKELALDQEEIPFDPDYDRYAKLEELSMLVLTTARHDARLVGWYLTVLGPHPHYKSTLFGLLDVFYLLPEYRKGPNGLRLFMAMESQLRSLGARELVSISKTHAPVDAIFQALQWRRTGVTYTKLL